MLLADANFRLDAQAVDYVLLGFYFVIVLGIGVLARRSISSSLDFFLSGRSLPAWVTGLAFVSANLGAVEVFGMTANGAQFGIPTVHYYWIGAIPAMVFLGIVMMPFYYGSKVRSVPEYLRRRFGPASHLVNGISFATAQVLISGINLFALGSVVNVLLGWPLWLSIVISAAIVLTYTAIGGLSAAIYNEVLQFFVIIAMLIPLTVVGLHRVGGWEGLVDRITDKTNELSSWPGTNITGIGDATLSVLGIVFGLGFVLSFGYWTTNFAEVQRGLSAKSMSAAKRTPLIAAYPQTRRARRRSAGPDLGSEHHLLVRRIHDGGSWQPVRPAMDHRPAVRGVRRGPARARDRFRDRRRPGEDRRLQRQPVGRHRHAGLHRVDGRVGAAPPAAGARRGEMRCSVHAARFGSLPCTLCPDLLVSGWPLRW
ncbi:hypothetical protein JOF56_003620 [Kibdelosporangium banguiense]|uniref:Sodium:solute symporter family protein n=1 Tax=Kibdelosporangium banguiense TaxID=1365924 RepID=A0ABS4TFP5_9PSEU|nr:hypothetical protein [Kibdelosporangium banguiense]